jgi:hypothetical protein
MARVFTIPVTELKRGDRVFESASGSEIRTIATVSRGHWPGDKTAPAVIVGYAADWAGWTQAYLLDQQIHVIRDVPACEACFTRPGTERRDFGDPAKPIRRAVCPACAERRDAELATPPENPDERSAP